MLESKTAGKAAEVDLSHPVLNEFSSALADDLNIAGALGVMHNWLKTDHKDAELSLAVWQKMNSVLSIAPINEGIAGAESASPNHGDDDEAEAWRKTMVQARQNKDFTTSDEMRDKLIEAGYDVQIGKTDVTIRKKLA